VDSDLHGVNIGRVRDRVFGIETEYAVIYHPGREPWAPPTNLALYPRFEAALRHRLRSLPRALSLLRTKEGRFLENGGSFHYEATPEHYEHGLIEMASPECRDPFVLLRYERAKDELIEELAAEVNSEIALAGYRGEIRIGKNNVDSQSNTFGSHESYWVEDPLHLAVRLVFLPAWALLWILSLPVLAWLVIAPLAVLATTLVAGILLLGCTAILSIARPAAARRLLAWVERVVGGIESRPGGLVRRMNRLAAPLFPLLALHSALYNRFHFRALRRGLTAHLVTRTLYCGAGAIVFDGAHPFRLAQRPPFVKRLARIFPFGEERPIFELRDLFFRPWSALGTRRRLHLLIGDANLCEVAQALRIGVTALVLEAIESGAISDWPVLRKPFDALDALNRDPALQLSLELESGERLTAIEIQHRYLERVKRVLDPASLSRAPWKGAVLRMWEETLDQLARDPEGLRDRVDWIAKRTILRDEVPDAADWEALGRRGSGLLAEEGGSDPRLREIAYRLLRTDLRYHELGPRGGYRRLEKRGLVRRLSDPAEVRRARREPPEDTRAWARGRAIRWAHMHARSGGVSWHRARLGKFEWRWFTDPLDPQRDTGSTPDDPDPLG
jgi:proteasome accessory factor A